jgi:hypothetical protein
MKWTDCREIARWTVITAVVVTCLGGGHIATCALDVSRVAEPPTPTLGAFELSSSVEQIEGTDNLRVTIHATNTAREPQSLDANVSLVRRQFVGSMVSRTISPNDYKETLTSIDHVEQTVAASATADFEVVLKMDGAVTDVAALPAVQQAFVPTAPQLSALPVQVDTATYQVRIEQGCIEVNLADFVPKRPGQ